MSRVLHTSLAGKLEYDDANQLLTIDGFNVVDELLQMIGMEVHLEAVALSRQPEMPPQAPPPDGDFDIRRLLGSD